MGTAGCVTAQESGQRRETVGEFLGEMGSGIEMWVLKNKVELPLLARQLLSW